MNGHRAFVMLSRAFFDTLQQGRFVPSCRPALILPKMSRPKISQKVGSYNPGFYARNSEKEVENGQ